MTKRAGVTKCAGCASNLTHFVTKRAVVTKHAATGSPRRHIVKTVITTWMDGVRVCDE